MEPKLPGCVNTTLAFATSLIGPEIVDQAKLALNTNPHLGGVVISVLTEGEPSVIQFCIFKHEGNFKVQKRMVSQEHMYSEN